MGRGRHRSEASAQYTRVRRATTDFLLPLRSSDAAAHNMTSMPTAPADVPNHAGLVHAERHTCVRRTRIVARAALDRKRQRPLPRLKKACLSHSNSKLLLLLLGNRRYLKACLRDQAGPRPLQAPTERSTRFFSTHTRDLDAALGVPASSANTSPAATLDGPPDDMCKSVRL